MHPELAAGASRGSAPPGPSGRSARACIPRGGRARVGARPAPWLARAAPATPPRGSPCRPARRPARTRSPMRCRAAPRARAAAVAAATAPERPARLGLVHVVAPRGRTILATRRLRPSDGPLDRHRPALLRGARRARSRHGDRAVEAGRHRPVRERAGPELPGRGPRVLHAGCSRRSRTSRSRSSTSRAHATIPSSGGAHGGPSRGRACSRA